RRLHRPGAGADGETPSQPGAGELPPTGPYVPAADSHALQRLEKDGVSNGATRVQRAASDTTRQLEAALSTESSTRSPAFFRSAAQLGIQAAQALEHSHALGV